MKSPICEMLGIEFPLIAFSHCRDVVAAVSKAGGFGVFGASRQSLGSSPQTPESVEEELRWIDDHVGGKPYGIDLIIPENLSTRGEADVSYRSLQTRIPEAHRDYSKKLLAGYGVELDYPQAEAEMPQPYDHDTAMAILRVSLKHPIKLIANALGVPPPEMIALGREHGVAVAALIGSKEHALRQVAAGVDILVAQGTEAGGHCGEVSTLVLVPEVLQALEGVSDTPVLAAGGIMTGRQMAACMAMGAAGVWTGSVWLSTTDAETLPAVREKLLAASSRDTVRSRSRSGKPARQLRSAWTDAWDQSPDSPGVLPMPLQSMVSTPAYRAIDRAVEGGNDAARDLVSYIVGQGVGLLDSEISAAATVQEFKLDFLTAVERMGELLEE